MAKIELNTYVFGQSMFNWQPLPAEMGQIVELPIPPVKNMKEALVFISASCDASVTEEHYYAVYTRSLVDGPIPFHYLFMIGGNGQAGCNSDNVWVRMPDEGLPRVVYVQKMRGGPLPASAGFRSGATVLSMR